MDFKIKLYQNEGIQDFETDIFPNHFLLAICGKPGSGKTSLLKHLMKSETFFFKKFDFVFIISPSVQEFKSFFLPPENLFTKLDLTFLEDSIKRVKKHMAEHNYPYTNVLFILDDCITDLYALKNDKDILAFIFNRRHLLEIDGKDKGMVSIIITSQKFNKMSTSIRTCLSSFIFFKLNPIDYKILFEDLIYGDKLEFEQIVSLLNNTSDYSNFIIYRVDKNKYYFNFKPIN